jgi:hypothetical protein
MVNIVNVTSIVGRTSTVAAAIVDSEIISNPIGSGKILKINTLACSNKATANEHDVSVYISDDGNGLDYSIISNAPIPPGATLVVVGRDNFIYLEEGWSLSCYASADSVIDAICSYEEISDA